jgi:hypothetical protein
MAKKRIPSEIDKDPAEKVDKDPLVRKDAQGSQEGSGMGGPNEGSSKRGGQSSK